MLKKIFSSMVIIFCSLMIIVSLGCDIVNPVGEEKNGKPEITSASGWVVENIDPSYWTKWNRDDLGVTAFINFWIRANDPDGMEDIIYVSVTAPDGKAWVLRDKTSGPLIPFWEDRDEGRFLDHYNEEGGYFGGLRRYFSLDRPDSIHLGEYIVSVGDSADQVVTEKFNVNYPGSKSGSGIIHTESYEGSTSVGADMMNRATLLSAIKDNNTITIQFLVSDSRAYTGVVWLYDISANFITSSGSFKDKVNEGAGLYNSGGINKVEIQSSDLELGNQTFKDVTGIHLVLYDGAQYAPEETYDHVSISQYREIPFTFTPSQIPTPVEIIWRTKSPMPTGRWGLAAGVVDNKIYAIGGYYPSSSRTVEEYDPVTDRWTTKASMPTSRENLAVGVVNNKIYAIGGCCNSLSTVEEYDPATNQWSNKTSMQTERTDLAVGVVNGKIYSIGGEEHWTGGYTYLNTVEEYDPMNNTWTSKSPMPTARSELAIGVVGGKIYVIGGKNGIKLLNTVEEYDPMNDNWTSKSPMPTARSKLAIGV